MSRRDKVVDRAGEEEREVTNHAVLRYLQRCHGIDIEAIRATLRQLASESTPVKDKRGEHHYHPSGVILIINERGAIVTVLGPDEFEKYVGRKLANGERIGQDGQGDGE